MRFWKARGDFWPFFNFKSRGDAYENAVLLFFLTSIDTRQLAFARQQQPIASNQQGVLEGYRGNNPFFPVALIRLRTHICYTNIHRTFGEELRRRAVRIAATKRRADSIRFV